MLNQRKTSFTNGWFWQKGSVPFELILVHSLSGKRQYLSDMKGFYHLFAPKTMLLFGLKAAIIPANYVMSEFNAHVIEAENRGDDEMKEFDLKESVHRNAQLFLPNLQRLVTVGGLIKSFEDLALKMFSPRITDKLTKDVAASAARKVLRYSRPLACQKIFFTTLRAGAVTNAACLTYDVGQHLLYDLLDFLSGSKDSKSLVKLVRRNIVFIVKKGTFYTVSLFANALGYSVGTFLHTSLGGSVGASVFEMMGAMICSVLLDDASVAK